MEEWKDVLGYEGLYKVSNLGVVKSYDNHLTIKGGFKKLIKGKVLKPSKNTKGYLYFRLTFEGKGNNKLLHRLIAEAFIPNPEGLLIINHKDGNKDNNNLDNLEWCTVGDNNRHAFNTGLNVIKKGEDNHFSKLNFSIANDIRVLLKEGIKQSDIAKQFSISESRVSEIKHNKIWVS